MTDNPVPINSVAPLANVTALVSLIKRVQDRDYGLPGMACFYGFSGSGKSTAATFAANHYQAYCVQVKSVWTQKKLCDAILTDLGVRPARTVADMLDQVAEHLARYNRPLIIDEADHLVSRNMIEVIRDIYESSGAAIILIGEEQLPQKLQKWERVHGRMLGWVGAQPGTMRDLELLSQIYCKGVTLGADLKDLLLRMSNHSIRRISVNLSTVREFALINGLSEVSRAEWGKREFFTGDAPAPRRIAG